MFRFDQVRIRRDVNGMDIDSTVTMDCCCIFDSLPTVFNIWSMFYILTVKDNSKFLKPIKFVNIVVDKYLLLLSIL